MSRSYYGGVQMAFYLKSEYTSNKQLHVFRELQLIEQGLQDLQTECAVALKNNRTFIAKLDDTNTKIGFSFFIDGLDEYEGDLVELIDLIQSIN